MAQGAVMKGRLVFNPDFVLFLGTGLHARAHRHLSASITLSLDRSFEVRQGGSVREARVMLVRPDTEHALDARAAQIINVQLDPETDLYARLRDGALRSDRMVLLDAVEPNLSRSLTAACQATWLGKSLVGALLGHFGVAHAATSYDPRVAQALALLKESFPDALGSELLAKRVAASESRLMHLFREQVGVPLRRYMLWLRLRHLLFGVALGQTFTYAAHAAGFADSAHFARVFGSMFGLPPSALLRTPSVIRTLELTDSFAGPHAAHDIKRVEELLASLPVAS
jgi:AraC-like DNA-binding protein